MTDVEDEPVTIIIPRHTIELAFRVAAERYEHNAIQAGTQYPELRDRFISQQREYIALAEAVMGADIIRLAD